MNCIGCPINSASAYPSTSQAARYEPIIPLNQQDQRIDDAANDMSTYCFEPSCSRVSVICRKRGQLPKLVALLERHRCDHPPRQRQGAADHALQRQGEHAREIAVQQNSQRCDQVALIQSSAGSCGFGEARLRGWKMRDRNVGMFLSLISVGTTRTSTSPASGIMCWRSAPPRWPAQG